MQKRGICLSLLATIAVMNFFPQNAAAVTREEAIAAAKNSKANRNYRSTPAGEGALTPKMIEACILLNKDVDSNYDAINREKQEFDNLNRELTNLGERLKAAKDDVYSGGNAARREYDEKVLYYNARLPDLEKKLKEYRKLVERYQRKSDKFDHECNGQPYYEDDYAEMVKKLGRGM